MALRSPVLAAHGDEFARSLVEAMPDATLILADGGQVVFANDQAAALFGHDLEHLLDCVVEDLLPAVVAQMHHLPLATSALACLDLLARHADGSEIAVQVSLSPLLLGTAHFTVAAVRDVSERTQEDAQLHRVLRTLDASDDAIFIFDVGTLIFSFVNDGATRLTGYDRAELLTMTPLVLSPSITEAEERRLVQPLIGSEEASVASLSTMVRKDGSKVTVETTYHTARSPRDTTTWVITLARDITSRLARDSELAKSQRALRDVQTEADTNAAVFNDRERIARDLHDTVIQRLFGEGLSLQSTLRLVDEQAAERIRTTIDGLDETIRELRMAVFSLQGSQSAPGGLRGRLLAALTESTPALGFEPRLQFDGPIETIETGIAEELLHVLREALSNIARHAGARDARVAVAVGADVVLTVSDNGVGVPGEVIGGRGLTNMDGRARSLGGECSIVNRPTGGAVLTWTVPAGPFADLGPTAATARR
jgi:PAS domain S-box-containing protein